MTKVGAAFTIVVVEPFMMSCDLTKVNDNSYDTLPFYKNEFRLVGIKIFSRRCVTIGTIFFFLHRRALCKLFKWHRKISPRTILAHLSVPKPH